MNKFVEAFNDNLVGTHDINGGIQYIFRFNNMYGASVVRHDFSYGHEQGLWELAVISYLPNDAWDICYTTPLTNDVLGRLTEIAVIDTLQKIKDL
jgi:hypothetical protein